MLLNTDSINITDKLEIKQLRWLQSIIFVVDDDDSNLRDDVKQKLRVIHYDVERREACNGYMLARVNKPSGYTEPHLLYINAGQPIKKVAGTYSYEEVEGPYYDTDKVWPESFAFSFAVSARLLALATQMPHEGIIILRFNTDHEAMLVETPDHSLQALIMPILLP